MKFHIYTIPFLCVVVLAGCQTVAQKKYQTISENAQATDAAFNNCASRVLSSPAALKLQERFILQDNDPRKLEKLLIKGYATPAEKDAVLQYNSDMQACRKIAIEGYSEVHPAFVNMFAQAFTENEQIMAKVIKDELTVAETNSIVVDLINSRRQAWQETSYAVTQQYAQNHQYQKQQQQQAFQALQQWNYQQQMLRQNQNLINSMNRPVMTDCNYIGNNLSCTTY